MRCGSVLLVVSLLAACAPWAKTGETESVMEKRNMQPYPSREFKTGAPIRPVDGLTKWLDEHKTTGAKTFVVRIPVTTAYDRISTKSTSVGDLPIDVQDSALGVSFNERANQYGKGAGTVVLSLIGYWRGEGVFDVIQVEGVAPDGAAHAEIQISQTPN